MSILRNLFSVLSPAKPTTRPEADPAGTTHRRQALDKPGFYNGKHFTEYVDEVKSLKGEGRLEEAERLLVALIAANRAEARAERWEPAPWYENQLGIVYRKLAAKYRKEKNYKALVKVMEKHERRWPGTMTEDLAEARALLPTKRPTT